MKKINILIVLVLSVLISNAQIVYTDISPDFNVLLDNTTNTSTNLFPVDMNNDGIEDYNFAWNLSEGSLRITSTNPLNQMIIAGFNSVNGGSYLSIINTGNNISSTENFSSGIPFPVIKDSFFSNFQNFMNTNTYIGVRFESSGQNYYGWILVQFDINNFLVKEYAYHSLADSSLTGGEIDSVNVNIPIESVTLQPVSGNAEVFIGGSLALEAIILPLNASDMSLVWSKENQTGMASIDQNGVVYGEEAGTVLVNTTPNDGSGSTGQIEVLVISPTYVNSIDIFSANGENQVAVNNNLQIESNVLPTNSTNDSLDWSVVNISGSGTINQSGLFSAQSTGIVSIKAVTTDGTNISDSLLIEVNDPITLIDSINVRSVYNFENVSISQTLLMTADIFPYFANDTSILWSVEPITGTANISQLGILTPTSTGTVKVVASANDASQESGEKVITIVDHFSLESITVNTVSGNDIVDLDGFTQMQANLTPQEIDNIDILWSVENQDGTAFINNSGLLSPTSIGSVIVVATSLDGSNIQGTKVISIQDLTGIEENLKQTLVYPNPFKNKIFFQENKEIEFIQINSIEGKIIYKGNYKPTIDMSNFNNGIYIVKLSYKNNQKENLMMIKNL